LAERNAPIFAVWATPVLALGINDRLRVREPEGPRGLEGLRQARGRRVLELILGIVMTGSGLFIILPGSLLSIAAGGPAAYPEMAVNVLLQLKPNARVLAQYGWGGYVISRVYDSGGRVFVDGRNEMYSEQILSDYSHIYAADPRWPQLI
jgi:hypothetical protein